MYRVWDSGIYQTTDLEALFYFSDQIFPLWPVGSQWFLGSYSSKGQFLQCFKPVTRLFWKLEWELWICPINASVNSTWAQPPPPADPRELAFFLPWMANFLGWGLLSWQIPRGGEENRGQVPRPPSTVQHFLLIAQSNSAILKCDFLFQLTSSFVIALGF